MTRFDADEAAGRQKLVAEAIRAHRERGSPYLTLEADPSALGDADGEPGNGGEPVDEGHGRGAAGSGGTATERAGRSASEQADGSATERRVDDDGAPLDPPWVQFAGDVVNLDLTADELEGLEDLLGEFPAFKIRELERPESAEGVNVRVGALADAARVAQFVDRVFREVYGLPADFRLWAAEV